MKSRSSICANKDLRPRLVARALELEALKYGEFTLSSGKKSNYYFDGRKLSLDPEGAYLIGRCLLPLVLESGAQAVGGPTIGADPIVAALAMTSYIEGTPVSAFVVRSKVKEYGTRKLIEGNIVKGNRVAMVDDTCSTGGNLLQAIEALRNDKLSDEVLGKTMKNSYLSYKNDEWERYHQSVTDWEVKEYLRLF